MSCGYSEGRSIFIDGVDRTSFGESRLMGIFDRFKKPKSELLTAEDQLNAALRYANADGVKRDYEKALTLMTQAAERGLSHTRTDS